MQLGMIGLGRMGGNMAERCMRAGHSMVVTDINTTSVQDYVGKGAVEPLAVEQLVASLSKPRAAWVMLPAGEITGELRRSNSAA